MIEPQRRSRFLTQLPQDSIERIKQLVLASRNIVITCHVSPDGDALGSSCGLMWVLRALGKNVTVVTADCPPRVIQFLPGVRDVVPYTRMPEKVREVLSQADLLFCMDFNDLKRIDRLNDIIPSLHIPRIVIDHHLDPQIQADVLISRPEISSTSALLYLVLWQARWTRYINRNSAACIYTGMMTDTGNFSYNSNDPDLYLIISDLLRKGIDKDALYKLVMDTSTEARVRLMGYGQYKMQLLRPHQASLITLNMAELQEFGYSKGDSEGLVNIPLQIPEVTWSVFMREDAPDTVKVSMRSKGTFPVNLVCEQCFGGGGHTNAAGGEYHGSLTDAVSYLLSIIPNYDTYLS